VGYGDGDLERLIKGIALFRESGGLRLESDILSESLFYEKMGWLKS
jgi:hypothetical protein